MERLSAWGRMGDWFWNGGPVPVSSMETGGGSLPGDPMHIFSQCPKARVMSGSWVSEKEQKMAKGRESFS